MRVSTASARGSPVHLATFSVIGFGLFGFPFFERPLSGETDTPHDHAVRGSMRLVTSGLKSARLQPAGLLGLDGHEEAVEAQITRLKLRPAAQSKRRIKQAVQFGLPWTCLGFCM